MEKRPKKRPGEKQVQTRFLIVDALDELMQHKPIENIKVVSICKLAGISRTTFYEYFQDVYEVVTWLWDYIMTDSLYAIGVTLTHTEGHIKSFYALREYRSFFANAFKSKAYNSAMEYGTRTVKSFLIANAARRRSEPFTHEELLQIDFRNYGAANMTRQWIITGMQESPEEITAVLDLCCPPFFAELLNQTDERVAVQDKDV